VVVDLISTSEVHVSMAIEDELAKKIIDRLVEELRKTGTVRKPTPPVHLPCSLNMHLFSQQVTIHKDMAILSLVGRANA